MLAAFLVVVFCADPTTCADAYEVESWIDPTPAELQRCADKADNLRVADLRATCEVVPMAESAPE